MQHADTKLALIQYGYQSRGDIWLKYVGFSLFVWDMAKRSWSCYFRSYTTGDLTCWHRHDLPDGLDLHSLGALEAGSRIDTGRQTGVMCDISEPLMREEA